MCYISGEGMAHSLFALVAAAAFAFEEYWSNKQPLVEVTRDGSFLSDWDWDDKVPSCSFFNGSYEYTGGLCSHFALARMSSATQIESTDRALACAAHFQTDCILSPEVGLSIPAACGGPLFAQQRCQYDSREEPCKTTMESRTQC